MFTECSPSISQILINHTLLTLLWHLLPFLVVIFMLPILPPLSPIYLSKQLTQHLPGVLFWGSLNTTHVSDGLIWLYFYINHSCKHIQTIRWYTMKTDKPVFYSTSLLLRLNYCSSMQLHFYASTCRFLLKMLVPTSISCNLSSQNLCKLSSCHSYLPPGHYFKLYYCT